MILNTNHNNNFNFTQDVVHNNPINNNVNFRAPYIPTYLNYNNNNFLNKSNLFNNNNFALNQYMNPYNQQLNAISNYNKLLHPMNNYTNFNPQFNSKNYPYHKEKLDIECICDKQNYSSKNDLKQCILCHKYQHKSCINLAQEISPYLCFNCQFKHNHFYLRWKKTILPAKEFLYQKKWEDDPSLLKQGTKNFEFYLNMKDLYEEFSNNNSEESNSYYLAFLCLTNNGRPFHLGFPDNINIAINDKKFYNTESKGFKRPLLLSIENNKYYVPKRRHLITLEKYEIPNAEYFFSDKNNFRQKITISFANNLENYRGSEFEFVDIRHYLFYIGVFQEIKIPQLSLLRECKNLEEYFQIFKPFYEEKVMKIKWNKIGNFVSMGNELLNMNLISEVSNQKIICPVRGLFCQHSEIMDFGECCGYITSNNQVYKCFKCNRPLNIMYIDDMSEKLFNQYKNENYSQIYYSNKCKFIKGEKIEENFGKGKEEKNNKQSENEENESLSESFFKYHENTINKDEPNKENNDNNEGVVGEVIELLSDTESMLLDSNNNNFPANPALNIDNINLETNNRNDLSNSNVDNVANINNNSNNISNDNSNKVVIISNLDKSEDDIQPIDNTDNNIENKNKDNKNNDNKNEEIINLIEDDEDEKENQDNSNTSMMNNKIPEKEKEKGNILENNETIQKEQINERTANNNSDNSSSNKKSQQIENETSLINIQDINQQKNKENVFNMNSSKESDGTNDANKNDFLNKKRNKALIKGNKRKKKINLISDVNSPRKTRFRRIESSPSLKSKNINKKKKRKILIEKEKENNNINQISINKSNVINDISNNSNSSDSINNEQNNSNYINVSGYNDITNSNKSIKTSNINKLSKNKSEIKNKRRNSEITSSSNSNNTQSNIVFSEYTSKENNKNKNKRKKKKKLQVDKSNEKIEEKEKINNINFDSGKNKESETSNSKMNNIDLDNEDFIPIIDKSEKTNVNEYVNASLIEESNKGEYETIYIDRKDLIEVRPYNEYREKQREINEEQDEFLNDFDIFENELLNNNQMEFINYDYYNIQRKLREYCSVRYQGDEIFNGNKSFFNKFK